MDSKYGRIFTERDLERVLEYHGTEITGDRVSANVGDLLSRMDDDGVRVKFPEDEPIFVLRGRDKRALGTVRYYRDHQSPRAPQNHLDGLDKAVDTFEKYRHAHPNELKEPD